MDITPPPDSRPAPPPGFMISEQMVESRFWRLQLDLATAGARSLRWRGPVMRELADPETEPHLFQAVVAGVPGFSQQARFLRARARFDAEGAVLAVESGLGGGLWRAEFGVDIGQPALRIRAGWSGPPPGIQAELNLALRAPAAGTAGWLPCGVAARRLDLDGIQVVAVVPGAAWHAERGTVSVPADAPLVGLLDLCPGGEPEAARLAEALERRLRA